MRHRLQRSVVAELLVIGTGVLMTMLLGTVVESRPFKAFWEVSIAAQPEELDRPDVNRLQFVVKRRSAAYWGALGCPWWERMTPHGLLVKYRYSDFSLSPEWLSSDDPPDRNTRVLGVFFWNKTDDDVTVFAREEGGMDCFILDSGPQDFHPPPELQNVPFARVEPERLGWFRSERNPASEYVRKSLTVQLGPRSKVTWRNAYDFRDGSISWSTQENGPRCCGLWADQVVTNGVLVPRQSSTAAVARGLANVTFESPYYDTTVTLSIVAEAPRSVEFSIEADEATLRTIERR